MKNNNAATIRRLTLRCLRADHRRNLFLALAIALTTLLIAAVFSVAMSLSASMTIQQQRLMGTFAHAGVTQPTEQQIDTMKGLPYIKTVGAGNHVGMVIPPAGSGDLSLSLFRYDETEWRALRSPAYTDIVGRYPQTEDEIMMPRWVLDRLGIEPVLGMPITLTYDASDARSTSEETKTFRLSGWFTSYMHIRSGNIDALLVSEEFSDAQGKSVAKDGSATVIFASASDIDGQMERLKQDIALVPPQDIRALPMYITTDSAVFSTMLSVLLIVLFLMLMGYLLIYNVLYISISRNVRFFGLLKTIGATPRQIRSIILGQTGILCLIGIPIGLLAAAALSGLLLPAILVRVAQLEAGAVTSFSPIIYGGAALFALATALIGSLQPAWRAAGISPVEAAKYVGTANSKGKTRGRAYGKPSRMALRNVFRDRKRAVIVLLGLFLGMTVFMAVTTLVGSMNTDNYVAMYMDNDFRLENTTTAVFSGVAAKQVFDEEFIAAIQALPGFEAMQADSYAWGRIGYTDAFAQDTRAFLASMPDGEVLTDEEIAAHFNTILKGVDRAAIEQLNETLETPIDVDAFERGEVVLIATRNPEYFDTVDAIDLYYDGDEETAHRQVGLGGFTSEHFHSNSRSLAPTLVVSHTLMKELTGGVLYTTLAVDVLPGYAEEALESLRVLMDGNHDVTRTSRIEAAEELRESKLTMYILGGGIAVTLGFIGLLNFVNIMSVGVMVRKRELATMQSIGMTGTQVRRMLLCEGLWYAGLSIGLMLTAGVGITYGVFRLFQQQATYAVFSFPYLPVLVGMAGVLMVCVFTPMRAYHGTAGVPLVERLREGE